MPEQTASAAGLPDAPGVDGMPQWREGFLTTILRLAFCIGAVVGIPSIYAAVRDGKPSIVVSDIIALAIVFTLWRGRGWSYRARAVGLCTVVYLLGSFFIVTVGPVSLVYLMAFPVLGSVLLGMRFAVGALVLNTLTLFTVGWLAGGDLTIPGFGGTPMLKWTVITMNFAFVNSMITVACGLTVARLEEALERQRQANAQLLAETAERQRAEQEVRELNAGLEERVQRRTAQLAAANKELASFSYAVSHDLRAPLGTIDGFSAQLSGRILPGDPKGTHYISRIRAAARQMGELIDAMLTLAHVTNEGMHWKPVDLSDLAHDVLRDCAEREPTRVVLLEIEPGLAAQGDARLLRQVLENLLGNAWKFTSKAPEARIRFSRSALADEEVFVVSDNGAGFDMAYAQQLFAPFQRLHRQDDFPGTGVGLATAQKIVVRHGGHIWATSQPGEGASFHFTLGSSRPA